MNPQAWARARLALEIWLHRQGWAPLLLLGLASGLAAWHLWWIRPLEEASLRLEVRAIEGAAERQSAAAPQALELRQRPLEPGHRALPFPDQGRRLLEGVFATARDEGLRVDRSELQFEPSREMPWTRVGVSLQLQGRYPAVRGFVTRLMREHPNVSLDQLSFKRDTAEQAGAQVLVGLSAWYRNTAPTVDSVATPGGAPQRSGAR